MIGNHPKLIGVYAPARQSGKSTVADVLTIGYGYVTAKFAAPIYAMFIALCQNAGLHPDLINRALSGDLKESPLAQLGGLSFRTFAEGVGTKWGREMFSKTLWIDIARARFAAMLREGKLVVVDDMRFPNEFQVIKDLGGLCVSVIRPGHEPALPSEGHLEDAYFDQVFFNSETLEELRAMVRAWMQWTGSPVR